VVVTGALYLVPYGHIVGYPLLLLSTYAHEMGHGIAAVLAGGRFDSLHIYSDASGVALSAGNFGRLGSAFVAAGGLVGPPVLAAGFFAGAARPRVSRAVLMVFGVAMLASCIIVVRGLFGWIFVAAIGAGCVAVAVRAKPIMAQAVVALLAIQLALSVFSRADYLFTDVAVTGAGTHPSDVAAIGEALVLPYWFWGGLIGATSFTVLAAGLWWFWRATRAGPGAGSSVRG
jgi:hypothetical protein